MEATYCVGVGGGGLQGREDDDGGCIWVKECQTEVGSKRVLSSVRCCALSRSHAAIKLRSLPYHALTERPTTCLAWTCGLINCSIARSEVLDRSFRGWTSLTSEEEAMKLQTKLPTSWSCARLSPATAAARAGFLGGGSSARPAPSQRAAAMRSSFQTSDSARTCHRRKVSKYWTTGSYR